MKYTKRQKEWIAWYETGSNDWWNAFNQYKGRRNKARPQIESRTWFNSVLKSLKKRGEYMYVPFIFTGKLGMNWVHPGFRNDGYIAETIEVDESLHLVRYNPIL